MTSGEKYKILITYRIKNRLEKGHKHHIIPQCLNSSKKDIVILSIEEHTLAHFWLSKHFNKVPSLKQYSKSMYVAYKGLRNKWIAARYKCLRDKEFNRFESNFSKNILTQWKKEIAL